MNLKEQLHIWLFPNKAHMLALERKWKNEYIDEIRSLSFDIAALNADLAKEKERPKPSMADLMRENLGVRSFNASIVEEDGYPRDFLNTGDDKGRRDMYIAQLHQIYNLEVWEVMTNYHIDYQGNFITRKAVDDIQVTAGRMTINGISLLKNDVYKGHMEFTDRARPPEKFDENSMDLLNETED